MWVARMTQFVIANNVNTQLAAAVDSSDTVLTLASSSNLPSLTSGQVMPLVLNDAATGLQYEVVYVTAIDGVTLTVERAQEGTGALSWSLGDYSYCAPTAGTVATLYGNPNTAFAVGTASLPSHAVPLSQAIVVCSTAPTSKLSDVIKVLDRQQDLYWQTIGTFTGYASPLVGLFHWGTTTTPRPFEELLIGQTIDGTLAKYKALIAWATVMGYVVSAGSWTAKTFTFGNNGDGTYILPDLRNQFIRATGTDADTAIARLLGTSQNQASPDHKHVTGVNHSGSSNSIQSAAGSTWPFSSISIGVPGTMSVSASLISTGEDAWLLTGQPTSVVGENRGPNTALNPTICL